MKTSLVAILFLLLSAPTFGQDGAQPEMQRHSWDVFSKRSDANPGADRADFHRPAQRRKRHAGHKRRTLHADG